MTVLDLETTAVDAAVRLETASAEEVLAWAADTFGERFCITSSMADGILAHLASRVIPGVDVVFLDTGYHFPETLGTRDAVAAMYDVNVVTVLPELTVAEQDARHGRDLFASSPDRCCELRKVVLLQKALAGYAAWASGVRRDESPTRRDTPVVAWDARKGKVKISPLARWTQADVDRYAAEHGVLINPLQQLGYASIGCAPCTRAVAPGEDPRAGRWAGQSKIECGIHL